MTTLKEAIRRACEICPEFGTVLPIASLADQTLTVTQLNIGLSQADWANRFMYRFEATGAPADLVRQVTEGPSSSGVLTHVGTAYSDKTATDETVFVSPFDPFTISRSAQEVLRTSKRVHWDMIPAHGGDRYYLDQYSWVKRRTDVLRLMRRRGPFLGRNPRFDDWNTVSTAGALEPDVWVKSGSGSTWTRVPANPYRGAYEVSLVRSGADAVVSQFIGAPASAGGRSLLGDGVDSLVGEEVTVGVIYRGDAMLAFIDYGAASIDSVSNGSSAAIGATHTLAQVSLTVPSTATELEVGAYMSADGTGVISEIIVVRGELTDAVLRDVYQRTEDHNWTFEEGAVPRLRPGDRASRGECYEIATLRPYATLDETRLRAGTAYGDSIDVPVDLWAYGLLARCFQSYAKRDPLYDAMAANYTRDWNKLRMAGITDEKPQNLAFRPVGGRARRA